MEEKPQEMYVGFAGKALNSAPIPTKCSVFSFGEGNLFCGLGPPQTAMQDSDLQFGQAEPEPAQS